MEWDIQHLQHHRRQESLRWSPPRTYPPRARGVVGGATRRLVRRPHHHRQGRHGQLLLIRRLRQCLGISLPLHLLSRRPEPKHPSSPCHDFHLPGCGQVNKKPPARYANPLDTFGANRDLADITARASLALDKEVDKHLKQSGDMETHVELVSGLDDSKSLQLVRQRRTNRARLPWLSGGSS